MTKQKGVGWIGRQRTRLATLLTLALLCLHVCAPLFHHHRAAEPIGSQTSENCTLCALASLSSAPPSAVVSLPAQSLLAVDAPIWIVTLAAPRCIEVRTAARAPPVS